MLMQLEVDVLTTSIEEYIEEYICRKDWPSILQ